MARDSVIFVFETTDVGGDTVLLGVIVLIVISYPRDERHMRN
jgi:hypothetical protein